MQFPSLAVVLPGGVELAVVHQLAQHVDGDAGQASLDAAVLDDLVTRYRNLAASALTANLYRRTAAAKDARRLARRFRDYEDMILRFATRPDLDIFSNNEAERTIRPAKIQQRSSGGSWRTLQGFADFALVQSCLSTATKWGISKLDALRGLFDGQPWLPPALEPASTANTPKSHHAADAS
jgi:transposase